MAELTGARNRFIIAATVSAGCSLIIRRPLAFAIAAGLGVIMADPEGMLEAMKEWKTKAEGGLTEEVEELVRSVRSLNDRLKNDAHWDGAARVAYEAVAEPFIEELEKLGTGRNGIGDALKSSADQYEMLSYFAVATAMAMVAWAVLVSVGKLTPATWVTSEIALNAGLGSLWTALRPILFKLGIFAAGVFAIYQGVSMQNLEQAGKFQNMMAMPMVEQYGLGNDPNSGALVQKPIPTTKQNGSPTNTEVPTQMA
ncbi:WXG100 family type VII secretion target [Nonomuraea muscovyensis]